MPTRFETLEDLGRAAYYAELIEAPFALRRHPGTTGTYNAHKGQVGSVENKQYLPKKISIDMNKPMSGRPIPHTVTKRHSWVYPGEGDSMHFYGHDGSYLGTWDGTKIVYKKPRRTKRPKSLTVQDLLEETRTMFIAHEVRTKSGWKAQVVFGNDEYDDISELPIVWEGDTVYTSDTEGDNRLSGAQKAHKAAQAAVNDAVEALFAKVKG